MGFWKKLGKSFVDWGKGIGDFFEDNLIDPIVDDFTVDKPNGTREVSFDTFGGNNLFYGWDIGTKNMSTTSFDNKYQFYDEQMIVPGSKTQQYTYYGIVNGTGQGDNIVGNDELNVITNKMMPSGPETLNGGGGNDTIKGLHGNDTINGGSGDDIISGDKGSDSLSGNSGSDLLFTGDLTSGSSDRLNGGSDADTFFLGEASSSSTDGGVNWNQTGIDVIGDFSDLFFSFALPQLKLTKEVVPMLIKTLKNIEPPSGEEPDPAAYATIEDFNPREDVVVIPLANSGPNNVFVSNKSNSTNNLTFEYDKGGNVDNFGSLEFDSASNIFGDGSTSIDETAQTSFENLLMQNAITIDSSGAVFKAGGNATQLNLEPEVTNALKELGSKKFMVLGAHSGVEVYGDSNENYFYGTNHGDIISGYQHDALGGTSYEPDKASDDEFRGFDGNDVFYGGGGSNSIYGGADDSGDTAAYTHATSGITADLSKTSSDSNGTFSSVSNGFGGTDKLFDIENIMGSKHDDSITGDGGKNILAGDAGSDTLTGGSGQDTFVLSAGDGTDLIQDMEYYNNPDSIQLSPQEFYDTYGKVGLDFTHSGEIYNGTLTLNISGQDTATIKNIDETGIENVLQQIEFVGKVDTTGTENATDILIGDSNNNNLWAIGGDDYVYGGDGNDTVLGGRGNDVLLGGDGNDYIRGYEDSDVMIGGEGADTFAFLNYESRSGVDRILDYENTDIIQVSKSAYGISTLNELDYNTSTGVLSVLDGKDILEIEGPTWKFSTTDVTLVA
ncbi:MAG: calcium-binding protein [Cyanobacteria bacterium J06592_8]